MLIIQSQMIQEKKKVRKITVVPIVDVSDVFPKRNNFKVDKFDFDAELLQKAETGIIKKQDDPMTLKEALNMVDKPLTLEEALAIAGQSVSAVKKKEQNGNLKKQADEMWENGTGEEVMGK